jgi:hypothetical protein
MELQHVVEEVLYFMAHRKLERKKGMRVTNNYLQRHTPFPPARIHFLPGHT